MGWKLTLLALLLLAAPASATITGQVTSDYQYPPTTVAGLANYKPPAGTPGWSEATDATTCVNGGTLTGGGSQACRVAWTGSAWVGMSSGGGGGGGSCPVGSTLWTTGVSDHVGIKLNSCSNVDTPSESCSVTAHTITGSTTASSAIVTLSGYTPSSADIGKIAVIGMAYTGVGGGGSTVGAGGNHHAGQTMRGKINSVAGQNITLVADPNAGAGNTAYIAGNTLSNVSVDIGTDNAVPLQTALNSVPANGTLCVPPGSYQVDFGVHITTNKTIFCQPNAVFYDPRNDGLPTGSFFNPMFISFQNTTGGGVNGCTYVGTNTGIYWKQFGTQPNTNRFIFTAGVSGMTFQHTTAIDMWGDTDIALSTSDDVNFSNNNTVSHTFTQNGWAYGPSIIAGHGNTFDHNVMRDVCNDVEPNNTTEGNQTYGNTFSNFACTASGQFFSNATYSTNESIGGGGPVCSTNATCVAGQTISGTNTITGHINIYRGTGPYSGVTCSSNSTGSDQCNQSPSSNCGTGC